jgi:hypothetical protein
MGRSRVPESRAPASGSGAPESGSISEADGISSVEPEHALAAPAIQHVNNQNQVRVRISISAAVVGTHPTLT